MCMGVCHGTCVEVRVQIARVGSLLLSHQSWRSNSDNQAWDQEPSCDEPSQLPSKCHSKVKAIKKNFKILLSSNKSLIPNHKPFKFLPVVAKLLGQKNEAQSRAYIYTHIYGRYFCLSVAFIG